MYNIQNNITWINGKQTTKTTIPRTIKKNIRENRKEQSIMNNPEAQETLGTRHIMKTQQKKNQQKRHHRKLKRWATWTSIKHIHIKHGPPLNTYISNMDSIKHIHINMDLQLHSLFYTRLSHIKEMKYEDMQC